MNKSINRLTADITEFFFPLSAVRLVIWTPKSIMSRLNIDQQWWIFLFRSRAEVKTRYIYSDTRSDIPQRMKKQCVHPSSNIGPDSMRSPYRLISYRWSMILNLKALFVKINLISFLSKYYIDKFVKINYVLLFFCFFLVGGG